MIDLPFSDLSAWTSYFASVKIPVLRHTEHDLASLREDMDNVTGRMLAAVVMKDPLMTLRVLAYIEANRRQRQTTDITTIERAIMMIGIEPFFREFNELPIIEEHLRSHPKALLGLLKVIGRARKAAHWAREWAIARHDLDVDEITVAALLHDFAEILMWSFAPELATRVRETQAANRARRSVAVQTEIYGIALFELKAELARAWRLPQLLSLLMAGEHADNPRVRNVKLAVDLARHSANGWDDAALPDDFKAIEELIHISHESLLARLGLEPPPAETPTETAAEPPPPVPDQPQ